MSTSVIPPSSDEAGPSTLANLPPLAELARRSVKRTRAVYVSDVNAIDDGLAKA